MPLFTINNLNSIDAVSDICYEKHITHIGCHFINMHRAPNNRELTDKTVYNTLLKYFPFLTQLNLDNVVIAGGSVCNAILNLDFMNDLDLFIFGVDAKEANCIVERLLNNLIEYCKKNSYEYKILKSDYGMRVKISDENTKDRHIYEVHITFILYNTVAEILYGFDIGSCSVGICDETVYFSALGAFAHKNMVNIYDPTRMTPIYFERLDKYLERHFNVYVPFVNKYRFSTETLPGNITYTCEYLLEIDTRTFELLGFITDDVVVGIRDGVPTKIDAPKIRCRYESHIIQSYDTVDNYNVHVPHYELIRLSSNEKSLFNAFIKGAHDAHYSSGLIGRAIDEIANIFTQHINTPTTWYCAWCNTCIILARRN